MYTGNAKNVDRYAIFEKTGPCLPRTSVDTNTMDEYYKIDRVGFRFRRSVRQHWRRFEDHWLSLTVVVRTRDGVSQGPNDPVTPTHKHAGVGAAAQDDYTGTTFGETWAGRTDVDQQTGGCRKTESERVNI